MNTRNRTVFLSLIKDPSEPALISDQDLLQIQWGWEEEIHPSCFVFETPEPEVKLALTLQGHFSIRVEVFRWFFCF